MLWGAGSVGSVCSVKLIPVALSHTQTLGPPQCNLNSEGGDAVYIHIRSLSASSYDSKIETAGCLTNSIFLLQCCALCRPGGSQILLCPFLTYRYFYAICVASKLRTCHVGPIHLTLSDWVGTSGIGAIKRNIPCLGVQKRGQQGRWDSSGVGDRHMFEVR